MRTSTALETRFFGKAANESDFFGSFQRKDVIRIFQKNHGLFCNVARFFVIFFHGKFLWGTMIRILKNNTENAFYSLIENFFFQGTVFDCFNNQGIVCAAGRRHLQFQSCFQAFHTVIDCTPVRHHVTFKSPVSSKYICKKPFVFRCKGSVNLVIRAHKGIWLCFFYSSFKSRKINFTESSFVCLRRVAHTMVFLVVCGKMFDGSSYVLGLYTIYKCGGNFTGKIWIFRIIFKVSSAKRGTFDIYCRSKNHRYIVGLSFFSDGFTHFFHQFPVKGAGA